MTPKELGHELSKILPTAFNLFKEKQKGDYAVFNYSINASGSDEQNQFINYEYNIELYTRNKEQDIENKIMSILDVRGIEYEISESVYIESEKRFMTVFTFSFLTLKEA
ncbi:hypothetical protein [Dielma fastidiosa]|uniref:DUF3168 domain-containing protein n=1 Tax=Dielma fastidiosa TaxID=1034346 RepID=A0A318KCN4_9FIRM|nr:hypothetical protein [Dielma fastidiosa]PXX74650.1 hypothetical protein DES51_12236 [Dielma fastidiosa]